MAPAPSAQVMVFVGLSNVPPSEMAEGVQPSGSTSVAMTSDGVAQRGGLVARTVVILSSTSMRSPARQTGTTLPVGLTGVTWRVSERVDVMLRAIEKGGRRQ